MVGGKLVSARPVRKRERVTPEILRQWAGMPVVIPHRETRARTVVAVRASSAIVRVDARFAGRVLTV